MKRTAFSPRLFLTFIGLLGIGLLALLTHFFGITPFFVTGWFVETCVAVVLQLLIPTAALFILLGGITFVAAKHLFGWRWQRALRICAIATSSAMFLYGAINTQIAVWAAPVDPKSESRLSFDGFGNIITVHDSLLSRKLSDQSANDWRARHFLTLQLFSFEYSDQDGYYQKEVPIPPIYLYNLDMLRLRE